MFQKTLNTTQYSLSPNLSFVLLSYDQSGQQSKYKLINLKKRLEYFHLLIAPLHGPCFSVSQAESLLAGSLINQAVWVTDQSLILLLENIIYYLVIVLKHFIASCKHFGFYFEPFFSFSLSPCSVSPICFYNEMNFVSPSLNSLCMQPDVNGNNSEELVKSSEETLTLTLNKQYQGKNH